MRTFCLLLITLCGVVCPLVYGQTVPAGNPAAPYSPLATDGFKISPITQPEITPGVVQLLELETKFASAVAARGGKAFASWFAEDAVSLSNGRSPVMGRAAIEAQAQWDPKDYQLAWTAQGAQMGPSNDMGFTWGHYEGTSKDRNGQAVRTSGRYFTVWRKLADGSWKVAMDASAEEPPAAEACCTLPKP